MFWIGMIVGTIIGFIAFAAVSVMHCVKRYGSWEDLGNGVAMLNMAADNRKSYMQVFTDDEILGTVVFEEK